MTPAPNVVLARMVLSGMKLERIAECLSGTGQHQALAFLTAHREAVRSLAEAARHVDHAITGPEALGRIRAGFDQAARIAPDASVAAYTFGDPDLLRSATEELVGWLEQRKLLGADRDVLDLGCGTGRVAAAIAPIVQSVVGVDVSAEMIAEARRRYPGIRFEVVDGRGLTPPPTPSPKGRGNSETESPLPLGEGARGRGDSRFHLILAADTFPYLIQAGVAEQHVADAAALLRPGGALAVLNLSYRGIEQDRADAVRWAATYGFVLASDGDQPFTLWDGRAFLFLKPAAG